MVLNLTWSTPASLCPHRQAYSPRQLALKVSPGFRGLTRARKESNVRFETQKLRVSSMGYTYDPRDNGESRSGHFAMYRNAVYDESSPVGSSSGYKWQPVSDLEWCRLFDRFWFNKRITMSHSESYMVESNEGKPKIPRKGQGKKAGRGRATTRPQKKTSRTPGTSSQER